MSWSYSSPFASAKDTVRFLVTDTNTVDQLVTDEELYWMLSQHPNVKRAAAEVARQIAMQFARKPKMLRATDTAVDYGTRAEQFALLARQLTQEAGLGAAMPFAGGISVRDKQTQEQDVDRVRPRFTRSHPDDHDRVPDEEMA